MLITTIQPILELGLIYSLVAMAIYLSFRIAHFPDLTVDGSFPLGAAVTAALLTQGCHPLLATFVAILAGLIAGALTGILHVRLRILGILASILTMSALYSINIRIMGRPNLALLNLDTLVRGPTLLLLLLAIVLLTFLLLTRFLASDYGLALRAAGTNPRLARAYGVNQGKMTISVLALSNGLVALAGALFAQAQGFADVSFGTGTIIIGLASLMIGEALLGGRRVSLDLLACILGAILYRAALALALNSQDVGLEPSDLNLVTALIVVFALSLPLVKPYLQRGAK